jgi:DNA-binding transcriptional LysR family regulator
MLDIVQDNIDLAIRQAILPDSELVSRVLAPDRRVLVASPDYVARHGAPRRPRIWPIIAASCWATRR